MLMIAADIAARSAASGNLLVLSDNMVRSDQAATFQALKLKDRAFFRSVGYRTEPIAFFCCSIAMAEIEPFSIKVNLDAERPDRFRWSIYINGKLHNRSEETFGTRGDAALGAVRMIEHRRLASLAKTA
jgi:hypothetical protein